MSAERRRRCVFVHGPESSGSRLIAKIVAHVLGVHPYEKWNAIGWSHGDRPLGEVSEAAQQRAVAARQDTVCHRSLPYDNAVTYPDIDRLLAMNRDAACAFILTTRDAGIVELSKRRRFRRSAEECRANRERSRELLAAVIRRKLPHFIWSYETFMYLREDYLRLLYAFLGVESDFFPPQLVDGNAKYVVAASDAAVSADRKAAAP